MNLKLIAAAIICLSHQAGAQDFESMQRATELGTIIGSEKLCELTLDQAGIEAWITANVAEDDLSFASTMNMMSTGTEYQIDSMSESAKTAHCTTVTRTAKAAGLIK